MTEKDAYINAMLQLRTHLQHAVAYAQRAACYVGEKYASGCAKSLEAEYRWCAEEVKKLMGKEL